MCSSLLIHQFPTDDMRFVTLMLICRAEAGSIWQKPASQKTAFTRRFAFPTFNCVRPICRFQAKHFPQNIIVGVRFTRASSGKGLKNIKIYIDLHRTHLRATH